MIVFGDKCFNSVSFLIVVCALEYSIIGREKIKTAAKYVGYESSDVINAQMWQIIIKILYFAAPLAKVSILKCASLKARFYHKNTKFRCNICVKIVPMQFCKICHNRTNGVIFRLLCIGVEL